ncbi:MAG TPA: glucokinase [Allosphingosinicella sp.]|nr:glucokinase [Allosphingosinicella sp.]
MQIVSADIGGTHARLALAELRPGARPAIGKMRKYRTRESGGLAEVWAKFARDSGVALPPAAAIAVAAPIEGDTLIFMNNDWRIPRWGIVEELGLERLTLLNDFGAVAQAVSMMAPDELIPVCGPGELPAEGIATVLGIGTGLGVAILDRRGGGVRVIETEASHIGFCPLDEEEEALSDHLTARYGRASVERVCSGPGLIDVYASLGGGDWDAQKPGLLWDAAIGGGDPLAEKALAILTRCFASATGDIALAQGATGVAITGGLSNRIAHLLQSPVFEARFTAKGRYRPRMQRTPVRLATEPEPGLLGAAIAFQREWLSAAPS